MRAKHLIASIAPALALTLATPAVAQDAAADEDIWAEDPFAGQDDIAETVHALMGALLDLPVGGLVAALPEEFGGAPDVRPGDTVRDLAARNNPDFEEDMQTGALAATAIATTMMERLRAFLPELEAMGEEIQGRLAE